MVLVLVSMQEYEDQASCHWMKLLTAQLLTGLKKNVTIDRKQQGKSK